MLQNAYPCQIMTNQFLKKNKKKYFKWIILALKFSHDKVPPKLPFLPILPLSSFIRSIAYQSFAKLTSSTQRIIYFLRRHSFMQK